MPRHRLSLTYVTTVLLLLASIGALVGSSHDAEAAKRRSGKASQRATEDTWALAPYRHLGAWIDMYDPAVWRNPEGAVAGMVRHGVSTLYLETSNWGKRNDIYRPARVERFLDSAHANGIKVVAWYVPGFQNLKRDIRRTMAAIKFQTAAGERFDGFALDIEATEVRDISRRNTRLLRLTNMIRNRIGNEPVLGAIVPEAGALYWPGFPYSSLRAHYDVFLPMGYFSYRVSGESAVREYTARNIAHIRRETADPNVPVHPIGGIAGEITGRETAGYVDAVLRNKGIGGSLYDFPITRSVEWKQLHRLRKPAPTSAPREDPLPLPLPNVLP